MTDTWHITEHLFTEFTELNALKLMNLLLLVSSEKQMILMTEIV